MSQNPKDPKGPKNPKDPKDPKAAQDKDPARYAEKYKELKGALDEAEFEWLRPHLARQAVIVVDRELDLVEVGVRLAQDDVPTVQGWLQKGLLAKPGAELLGKWEQAPGLRLQCLIVQPYVLVQDILWN